MQDIQSTQDALLKLDDCEHCSSGDGSTNIGSGEGSMCYTVKQVIKAVPIHARVEWRIEGFKTMMELCKPGDALMTKYLSFPPAPDVMWLLYVYPNGYRQDYRGNLCIFLDQTFGDASDEQKQEMEALVNYRSHLVAEDGRNHAWLPTGNPCINHEAVKALLRADGSLVIGCEFKYLPPVRMLCSQDVEDAKKSDLSDDGVKRGSVADAVSVDEVNGAKPNNSLEGIITQPSPTASVTYAFNKVDGGAALQISQLTASKNHLSVVVKFESTFPAPIGHCHHNNKRESKKKGRKRCWFF